MERGIIFELHEGEKVLSVIRRHWLAFVVPGIIISVMFLAFVIGFSVIAHFTGAMDFSESRNISENLGSGAFLVISSMYILSLLGYFYISWLDYYLDMVIITNEKIIRLEQIVLFGRKVAETSFHHIQDASSQVEGVVGGIFNVGTIFVETAGERENFSFRYIKSPSNVSRQILDLQRGLWEKDGIKDDIMAPPGSEIKNQNKGSVERPSDYIEKTEEIIEQEEAVIPEVKPEKTVEPIRDIPDPAVEKKEEEFQTDNSPENKKFLEALDLVSKKEIGVEEKINTGNNKKDVKLDPTEEKMKEGKYEDGRVVTDEGVIWQADQEVDEEILEVLNSMED